MLAERLPASGAASPSVGQALDGGDLLPSAWTASTVHDFTDSPSRWTVQAPQDDVSQPTLVPVRPQFVAEVVDEQQARLDVVGVRRAVDPTVTFTSGGPLGFDRWLVRRPAWTGLGRPAGQRRSMSGSVAADAEPRRPAAGTLAPLSATAPERVAHSAHERSEPGQPPGRGHPPRRRGRPSRGRRGADRPRRAARTPPARAGLPRPPRDDGGRRPVGRHRGGPQDRWVLAELCDGGAGLDDQHGRWCAARSSTSCSIATRSATPPTSSASTTTPGSSTR